MTREDAAAAGTRWGVRTDPGVVWIDGPRTVVFFAAHWVRVSRGWYRVMVNVPGVRFKIGGLHHPDVLH